MEDAETMKTVCAVISRLFLAGAWGSLIVYTVEMFPTMLRLVLIDVCLVRNMTEWLKLRSNFSKYLSTIYQNSWGDMSQLLATMLEDGILLSTDFSKMTL